MINVEYLCPELLITNLTESTSTCVLTYMWMYTWVSKLRSGLGYALFIDTG